MEVHLDRRLRSVHAPADGPVARVGTVRHADFGVYVHVPFCARALRLLRLRHLDRPRPPDGALRRGLRHARSDARVADGTLAPAPRACSSAAARRRACPPSCWRGSSTRCSARPGRRGHRRVQPRGRLGRALRRVARRRGDPGLLRRAVDGPPRARRRSGGATARRRWRRARGPGRRGRVRRRERRPDLRRGGRDRRRTSRPPSRPCSPSTRPPARERLRPHRRAGHAPGRATRPGTPTTTSRPGATRWPTTCSAAAGYRLVRGVELGRARARVPAQPALLGPGRLPRHRLRRPLAPRAGTAGGTCAPPSATSPRRTPASPPLAGEECLSRTQRAFEGLALALRTVGRGARHRWCPTTPTLDGLVERRADGRCSTRRGPAPGQRGDDRRLPGSPRPVSCGDDRASPPPSKTTTSPAT